MSTDEGIYADLPEDGLEDIYADLEDELNKAGYDPEHMLDQPAAPALPFRNQTAAREPPQQPKEPKINKKLKKEKAKPAAATPAQKKKGVLPGAQRPGTKPSPLLRTGTSPVIPTDMLNQRRLLKKVERIEPRRADADELQTDFRSNLRKVKPEGKADTPKGPPPILKPKPSLSSIDTDPGRIRYRRLPLSQVDLSNPPAVNRDKKPRLAVYTQEIDDTYEDDVYDDVTNVVDQDLYDDVENLSSQPNGHYTDQADQDVYDDVDNLTDMGQPNPQDIYDDVENQNPDMADDYYDDVESIGINRKASSDVYDDVENVGITRKVDSPTDTYDDICSPSAAQKAVASEEMYEIPDSVANQKEPVSPGKKLSAAQEKKLKSEEIKVRKRQVENEKKRLKELEKYTKEMEKKRKVFMEYYNIKDSDKPLMVAQVSSNNDLRGKQNLEVNIGDIVHVMCKEHKKMPKGAWLAEKSDHSAIGFIAPDVLNQNMLSTFDDY